MQSYPETPKAAIQIIPGQLKGYRQFVGWRFGETRPNGRREKTPINPRTGDKAKTDDPRSWGTYQEACEAVGRYGLEGVGWVFTKNDPFSGLDLDGCRDAATGELKPWAQKIIRLTGSYAEISPSGTGVKIIVGGTLPIRWRHRTNIGLYSGGGFFALTGDRVGASSEIAERQGLLDILYRKLAPVQGSARAKLAPIQGEPAAKLEDEGLLHKARRAVNGRKFSLLYDRGITDSYPSESEADLALLCYLAFWTGRDPERMERLFSASALGEREKWGRKDYRKRTISAAIAHTPRVYEGKHPRPTRGLKDTLQALEARALAEPWPGRNGARNLSLLLGLITTGGVQGRAHPEGVVVTASLDYLAWRAGFTKPNVVLDGIADLEKARWVRVLRRGREEGEANIYLLKSSAHLDISNSSPPPVNITYIPLRGLALKVRENGRITPAGTRKVSRLDGKSGRTVSYTVEAKEGVPLVKGSIGKRAAWVLLKAFLAGGAISLEELSSLLKHPRPRDLRAREVSKLLRAGLLEVVSEDTYVVPNDIEERLRSHLRETGALNVFERQREALHHRSEDVGEEALAGPDKVSEIVAKRDAEARDEERERIRQKVGMTPEAFVLEELEGRTGMYLPAMLGRFKERGGTAKELYRAIDAVGARIEIEKDGSRCVYLGSSEAPGNLEVAV